MLNYVPSFENNLHSDLVCSLGTLHCTLTFNAKELSVFPFRPLHYETCKTTTLSLAHKVIYTPVVAILTHKMRQQSFCLITKPFMSS